MIENNRLSEGRPRGLSISSLISSTAQAENTDNFKMVSIDKLEPFYDHPFKPYSKTELIGLAESIKEIGIQHAIVVRTKDDGNYEILSGHNRTEAARLAGLSDVPVKVLNVDDDKAKLIVTDTNLKQREEILPSDKAKAYKMQLEVLKRQGKRNDLISAVEEGEVLENNLWASCPQVKSRNIVAEMNDTSPEQISRYIRLNHLIEGLLDKVDSKRLTLTAGVEISYVRHDLQAAINELMEKHESLLVSQNEANIIRQQSCEKVVGISDLELILGLRKENKESKPKSFSIKSTFKAVEKRFKKIEPEILEKLDEEKLQNIISESIQKYIDEMSENDEM